MWPFTKRAAARTTPPAPRADERGPTRKGLERATGPDTRPVARASITPPFLSEIGETDGLTSRRVYAFYCERAEYLDLQPLSELRFFRELKAAGILRYRGPRSSSGHRPWLYRVQPSVVIKFPRASADHRRVA